MRFLWNASPTSDECGSFVFRSIQDPCWDTVGARVITASTLINASFLIIWVLQRGGGNVVVLLWPKGGIWNWDLHTFPRCLEQQGEKGGLLEHKVWKSCWNSADNSYHSPCGPENSMVVRNTHITHHITKSIMSDFFKNFLFSFISLFIFNEACSWEIIRSKSHLNNNLLI